MLFFELTKGFIEKCMGDTNFCEKPLWFWIFLVPSRPDNNYATKNE